jgi:hypothetical protein
VLSKDPVALRLLVGYLAGTYDMKLSGGEAAVGPYDQHIIDLIALAPGAEGDARDSSHWQRHRTAGRHQLCGQ